MVELPLSAEKISDFVENGVLLLSKDEALGLHANQYVAMHEYNDKSIMVYGKYRASQNKVVAIMSFNEGVWGIFPKNLEQKFALDALLDPEVKMVTLSGQAGTGKTLLAIAAALELTLDRAEYIRTLVARPIQPLGKDIGFLPGGVEDKIGPWMLPLSDALDFLFGKQKSKNGPNPQAWLSLKEKGIIQIEPLTYIRGRSIPNQFFIIDEAQNLSPHEVKTIVTRMSEGSKIVLSGDCDQIDNPYLDTVNNGLNYAIERLKEVEIVSHVSLKSGERSQLSKIASSLL